MTITTKDIIRFFPLDETFKQTLLEEFDSLPHRKKAYMVKLLWDAFYLYYDLLMDKYTTQARDKILTGEEIPDNMFHARIVEKTEEEIMQSFQGVSNQGNIEEARKAMEMIVKEIQATKLAKKKATTAN